MIQWLVQQPDWVQGLIRALIFVLPLLLLVPGLIWWERRLLSWMQDRWGPNRVATWTFSDRNPFPFLRNKKLKLFGLLQPIADGLKLFTKEDFTPKTVDVLVYFLAPAVALFPAFALGGTMPWGPVKSGAEVDWHPYVHLTPIADVNIGVLYIMAVSSLGVYGIVLGGYSGNNKYSLLGGLRSSAQLISYELAMGMALAAMVTATGSLKLTEMVAAQQGPLWGIETWNFYFFSFPSPIHNWFIFTPFGFVAAVIFAICMVAETNRAPFDLPEAENELVAGYHTEYSSMKFAVYFMGEYAAMLVFSLIFSTIFLGGYALPFSIGPSGDEAVKWLAPIIFFVKGALGITIYIWVRATLPRLRYDQLMNLGWKVLLPVGVANFLIAAFWVLGTKLWHEGGGWLAWAGAAAAMVVLYISIKRAFQGDFDSKYGKRTIRLVDAEPGRVEAGSRG